MDIPTLNQALLPGSTTILRPHYSLADFPMVSQQRHPSWSPPVSHVYSLLKNGLLSSLIPDEGQIPSRIQPPARPKDRSQPWSSNAGSHSPATRTSCPSTRRIQPSRTSIRRTPAAPSTRISSSNAPDGLILHSLDTEDLELHRLHTEPHRRIPPAATSWNIQSSAPLIGSKFAQAISPPATKPSKPNVKSKRLSPGEKKKPLL